MKYLLLAFSFCFFSAFVSAQVDTIRVPDVIVFNNGSSIQGKIVQITRKYIYIKLGSAPFSFHKSKISSIVYEGTRIPMSSMLPPLPVAEKKPNKSDAEYEYVVKLKREPLKKGFYNITYGSFIFSGGGSQSSGFYGYYNSFSRTDPGLAIENVSGIQFNQYVGFGIGLGYMNLDYREKAIPVYTEFRGYINAKKHSAYYNVAVGLTFGARSLETQYTSSKAGSYLHPAIGYKFGSDACAFMLDLGLKFSTVTYIYDTENSYSEELYISQRVVLRLGIML